MNDTTGTLLASAYTDTKMKLGCVYATGCNGAYMEDLASISKLADKGLPKDTDMIINCEWGAFDNEHAVLPRTSYDEVVDEESPRPGQQSYEKMIAGLYLGEIFRVVIAELYERTGSIFKDQDISSLGKSYCLDASFLSSIEL